jgi:dTMP kinase
MSGRFITLEGGEGAGKSTQIRALAERLAAAGIGAVVTREPGGTPGAEAIRALLVSGEPGRWDAATEALLMNAARADHVARVVRPALAAGRWVLSDRYADSTFAYQGGGKGADPAMLGALHAIATGGLWPDLTLLLDLPVAAGLARTQDRGGGEGRFEAHGADFHERIRAAFRARAAAEPERFRVIDASAPADVVADAVWEAVSPLLPC